jgi:hypothetical protein
LTATRRLPVLASVPNVVHLNSAVHIAGDLHGQLPDLLSILRLARIPPSSTVLFLGDYVDRGSESVEVMSLLLCLKLRYPERVTLLRSNQESREMTGQYGFAAECKSEFGKQIHCLFCQAFNRLAMCAVVDNRVFCVHGWIGPGVTTLDHIGRLE